MPFAIAKALTDTAKLDAQPAVERRIELAFDRPTPFTKRGVGIAAARKGTDPVATVFIKDVQAKYLSLEETGGVRLPKRRALVLPAGQRVNQYGNLPRGVVQRLLGRPDVFSGQVKGVGGIWQRRKGGKVKLLIRFESEARYQPRFQFAKTVEEIARTSFPRRLDDALASALRTAR